MKSFRKGVKKCEKAPAVVSGDCVNNKKAIFTKLFLRDLQVRPCVPTLKILF